MWCGSGIYPDCNGTALTYLGSNKESFRWIFGQPKGRAITLWNRIFVLCICNILDAIPREKLEWPIWSHFIWCTHSKEERSQFICCRIIYYRKYACTIIVAHMHNFPLETSPNFLLWLILILVKDDDDDDESWIKQMEIW